ncbi:similar to Saccharomyces cerevisiae YML023C NSE5 Essential subunit of the Mms21-Smc5-Smc6 complex [Maudiozyma barnettii]|uniref:Similar to Saccharomyces cerevisiae YML023C NSE5 Essential subunit of the Mms21-Smc5-Smc6 complex n=1 Tax=Maudiozyma barnettii TaxID=61262 RepID=A0A8H2VAP2_9SACH|nr:Smc5-Smc6 complex subunit NSE5 [Kazachstania barnettii]CAB4251858.1 similar to Saccharomyces cerevisiae YML023C NSE5 Essential subunit of the Mms21-Smc5-Smc6 complex [Kazachstania barnettii]CAD1778137.1 similar to Saccharomyces cerevisiae YML023C NSE5 Essential subunit of the Mms21-Smc5-Smc6 complex [Kazachstania barnettii]
MSIVTSTEYVNGWNKENNDIPHYLVDLTERHLSNFEVLNSLALLQNYENLFTFIECQVYENLITGSVQTLLVPPFDIWLIILTVATVSTASKDEVLRENDVYNASRIPLNKRAIKILHVYSDILTKFNVKKYNQYDLELLRCQIFIVVDTLLPQTNRNVFGRASGRTLRNQVYSPTFGELKNPYLSYRDCLQLIDNVLGNKLINTKFSQPGEMINTFIFTLSNSLQGNFDNNGQFLNVIESWLPIFSFLLDMILLRQNYFIKNEIGKSGSAITPTLFTQQLIESPISKFLRIINSVQFTERFIECIFIDCPDKNKRSNFVNEVNTDNVLKLSSTYVTRTFYPPEYVLQCSMRLRRQFTFLAFHLLSIVPSGHVMVSPKLNIQTLIRDISLELRSLIDISHFQAFLSPENLERDIVFIPLLAEGVFNGLIEDNSDIFDVYPSDFCDEDLSTSDNNRSDDSDNTFKANFVNNLDTINEALREYTLALELLLMSECSVSKKVRQEEYDIKLKCCICVLTVFDFFCLLHVSQLKVENLHTLEKFLESLKSLAENFDQFCIEYSLGPDPHDIIPNFVDKFSAMGKLIHNLRQDQS